MCELLTSKGWFKTEDIGEWCHDKIEPYTMYADEAEELENRIEKGENINDIISEIVNRSDFRIFH